MSSIDINVKASNDQKHVISIAMSETVLELKKKVAQHCETPVERIRLIYSGRVLKDHDALETYKISEGHTVHMVRSVGASVANTTTTTTTKTSPPVTTGFPTTTAPIPTMSPSSSLPSASIRNANPAATGALPNPWTTLMSRGGMSGMGGIGGMGIESVMMTQMMQDPTFAQYMSSMLQNPQVLESMISVNPAFQGMETETREILHSSQFQRMISSPDTLRQIAQMNSRLSGPMEGLGGRSPFGYNHLWSESASTAPTTTTTLPTSTATSAPGGVDGFNPFAAFGGGRGDAGVLGNPMATFSAQQMANAVINSSQSSPSSPTPLQQQQQQQQQRPEERFEVQLKQLNDMGFWDAAKNIRALQAAGGNVNGAIEILFSGK